MAYIRFMEILTISKIISLNILHCLLPINNDHSLIMFTLRWDFKTDGYDIGFGLFQEDPKTPKSRKQLISVERMNSHMAPESGSYTCENSTSALCK